MNEFICLYGTKNTGKCFYYEGWYCIKGSVNINYTNDEFYDGINVETVNDLDYIQADKPVESLDDLIQELEDY